MAEGAKLATGWLELTVSAKGAQKSIVDEVGGAGAPAGNSLGASLLGAAKKFAAPLAAAFGIGKAIATGFDEVKDAAAVTAQLSAGIASTGNAANVSVDGLNSLAGSIQSMTGQTDDSIGAAQGLLLTFTNIKNVGPDKIFDQATMAAADMAARMGGDAASKATLLGKALNDPVKGITALTRVGVGFTQQQKDQISAMVEAGDTLGAQKVILAELNTQFGGSAAAFGQTLPGQLERAKRGFEDFTQTAVGAITPLAGPVLELLIGGLARVTEAIAPMASSIGPVLQSVFGQIGATIGPVFAQIGQSFAPVFAQIGPLFAQLAPVFGSLLPPLLQLWQAFSPLTVVLTSLTPILPTIVGLLGQLGATIGGVLGQAVTALMPPLISVAQVLTGALSQAFTALMPVITTLIPIFGQIVGIIGGTFGQVLQALVPIISMIVGLFAQLLPQIMPLIGAVLGLVAPIAQLVLAVVPLVGVLLPPLVQLLGTLLTPILGLIQPIMGLLVPALQFVATVLSTVISWVAQAISWVVKFVTGNQQAGAQFQAVWSNIMSFFQGVGRFIGNIWNGLITGVSAFVGNVVRFFQDIPNKVGQVFAGAGRWLYDAGRNIIDGLINGAGSLLSNIGNFFLNLVPDWIKGPFKAALGIASPSRVFYGYGDNTVQGYIDGVKNRRGDMQRAITDSVPSMSTQSVSVVGDVQRRALAADGGVGADGDTYVLQGITTEETAAQLAAEIEKRKQRRLRRSNALALAGVS